MHPFARRHIHTIGFLALMLGMEASIAHAQSDRWGGVVIRNPTSVALPFQMRLGTRGPWTNYTVPARSQKAIYFGLDQNGTVPWPYIRFDCIPGDGAVTEREYRLKFYEIFNYNWQRGKPYHFKYNSSGTWLDLYRGY